MSIPEQKKAATERMKKILKKTSESISIVIPAYNEQDNIETTIQEAYTVAKKLHRDFEILVVNDASTDQTASILKRLQKNIKELRVITHVTNQGCGAALRTLYTNASKDLIYYLPGDGQIKAAELPKFLAHIDTHAMVLAHRTSRHDSFVRIFLSRAFHVLVWLVLGLPFPDIEGNILFRRELIGKIPLKASGVFMETELIYKTYKAGYPVTSVTVKHYARQGHKTQRAFVRDALLAIWEFSNNALRMRMGWY